MTEIESAYDRLRRIWLGMGNIKARCWFIGLEPGGTDGPDWPEIWQQLYGGAEVTDGRCDAGDPDYACWFEPEATLQTTWGPLIRCRLALRGGIRGRRILPRLPQGAVLGR